MPTLAAEPSLYPPSLLGPLADEQTERCWWVAQTRARQEKALARQLLRKKVPFYLPLVAKESLVRGRRVQSFIPLFGGYVFLFGTDDERLHCLATQRTARVLHVADGQQLTRDLRIVEQLIATDAPLTVERRLMPGQRVRIKAGALAGTEGTILELRGRTRLVVAVHFLQQGVSMEVDNILLEPLD